jgi:dGTPase
MDWADDIAYAVHDVEDFFRAGLIPLDRLTTDTRERDRFLDAAITREGAVGAEAERLKDAFVNGMLMQFGPIEPFLGSSIDRATLRGLTSKLIGRYINQSVSLSRDSGRTELRIDPTMEAEVRILKALTRHYVIESPSLVAQRFGQRALIAALFDTFCAAASSKGHQDWTIFPVYFQEALRQANDDTKQIKRIVADLIAAMSEAQVVAVHQRLSGQSLGSAMESYLQ